MKWLVVWLVLAAIYLAVDLPLRRLSGEGWLPDREALWALGLVPLLQACALRFVQWMRRNVRPQPSRDAEPGRD